MFDHESPNIQEISCPHCGGRAESEGELDLFRCQYCETVIFLNYTDANIVFQPVEKRGSGGEGKINSDISNDEYKRLVTEITNIKRNLERQGGFFYSKDTLNGDRSIRWQSVAILVLVPLIAVGILYFWTKGVPYLSLALIGVSTPLLVSAAFRRKQLRNQLQNLEIQLRENEKRLIELERDEYF